jgi:hypothetical protein
MLLKSIHPKIKTLIISGLVPSIVAMDMVRFSYLLDLILEFNHHLGYAVQYDPGHGQK